MKRFFAALLALLLLFSAAFADTLDDVFDSGSLMLAETETGSRKPELSEIELTDGIRAFALENGAKKDPVESLPEILPELDFTRISASPAGSAFYFTDDGIFVLYNGTFRLLFPSSSRGAEDPDSMLLNDWMRFCTRPDSFGEQGILYSPDGKYAAVSNLTRLWNFGMDARSNVLLADLSTGEMFFAENTMRDNEYNTFVTGAFSADNRYYYYLDDGNYEEGKQRLCRYDLEDGTAEVCCGLKLNSLSSELAALRDGSLMILDRDTSTWENCLVTVSCTDGEWSVRRDPLGVDASFRSSFLQYAPESDRFCTVLTRTERETRIPCAFLVFRPGENTDRFLCITQDTHEIVNLSADEMEAAFAAAMREAKNPWGKTVRVFDSRLLPYEKIDKAVFSPDGNYLLIKTFGSGKPGEEGYRSSRLFLVRLSDYTLREVQGVDADSICYSTLFPMRIEWNTEELILCTTDGTELSIKTYTFSAGE